METKVVIGWFKLKVCWPIRYKRGRKGVSREKWSRVFILRDPLLWKNIIRELWMIRLSWHVKAKSYFSRIVKLDQKPALFSVKLDIWDFSVRRPPSI